MIGKEQRQILSVAVLCPDIRKIACLVSIFLLGPLLSQVKGFPSAHPAAPASPVSPSPITLVQQAETSVGSGASSISQAFPSASTSGDLIVVTVKWGGQNLSVSSITDSRGNLYQNAVGPTNWSGTAKCAQTYVAKNIAGGGSPLIITVGLTAASTSSLHLYQFEYSGADPNTPLDAAGAATGSGTSLSSGLLITNNSNDLIHAVAFTDDGTTTAGAGFQTLTTFHGNLAENMNASAAGTYSATASNSTNANWFMHALGIKAAVSGGSAKDTTPPVVAITGPANNATVSGTVQVTASATDNVGVARVQLQLDGQNAGAAVTAAPYVYSWDTTKVSNGSHTLRAIATDTSNNSATSAVVTVTVSNAAADTTPPFVNITAPANNAVVSGTITVSATATDPDSPVSFVQLQVDGANAGGQLISAPYFISLDTTALSNGTHILRAVAQDPSANRGTSPAVTVTVSNTTALPSAITLVQQAELSVGSGASSISQSFPSASATGDLIVATVKWGGQSLSIASITDNKGNSYQSAVGPTNWSGTAKCSQTFYAKNIVGGGAPITVTVRLSGASTGNLHLYQFEYSGVDATSPVDSIGASIGTGTSISVGGLTTHYAKDLIHAVAFTDSGSTSPGPGFQALTTYAGNLAENETVGAVGTHSATATDSTGTNWFMHALAFKNASGGATGTDTTPPVVTITAPANNATVSATITLTATATDPDSPVSFVQFQVDGSNVGGQLTTAPYSLSLDTTMLTNGTHTLTAVGQDPSRNVGASPAVTITVLNASAGHPTLIYTTAVPLAIPSGTSWTYNGTCTSSAPCYRVPLPEPTTAGSTLIMAFSYDSGGNNQVFSVTDDQSNTWVLDATSPASNNKTMRMYRASNVTAGTSYIDIRLTSGSQNGYWNALVGEFFNVGALDGSSCSAASSATISAGNITPAHTGDLIFQAKYSASVTKQTASFTPGLQPNISWSLASQLLGDGAANQYGVYNSTVAMNPTFTQAASDSYISCAVALQPASAGAAATAIPRVVHQEHDAMPKNAANPWPVGLVVDVPNSAVYLSYVGNDSISSVSSIPAPNVGWTPSGADFNGLNGHNHVNYYCAQWSIPPGAVTLSINRLASSNDSINMIYVVQNATCNLDLDSGGQANSQGSIGPLTTCANCLTPTKQKDFIMANGGQYYCTATSLISPSGGIFDAAWFNGNTIDGPTQTDENNFWMHFSNGSSLSPITVTFAESCDSSQGDWAGRVAAYQTN